MEKNKFEKYFLETARMLADWKAQGATPTTCMYRLTGYVSADVGLTFTAPQLALIFDLAN